MSDSQPESRLKEILPLIFFPFFCAFMIYGCLHPSDSPRNWDGTVDQAALREQRELEARLKESQRISDALETTPPANRKLLESKLESLQRLLRNTSSPETRRMIEEEVEDCRKRLGISPPTTLEEKLKRRFEESPEASFGY